MIVKLIRISKDQNDERGDCTDVARTPPCLRASVVNPRSARGFTLLELVMVMMLMCVVAALSVPSFKGFGKGRRVGACAAQLVTVTQYARTQAVTAAETYRLNVDAATGTYWLTVERDGAFVAPTVLVDVPEDSAAVREETFGPTLTVARVRDAEEALERTNATSYGLAGAVFNGSRARGMDLARRMRTGMTSVNSVIAFASVPGLPFGGVGDSGFGRIHGEDGLKEFTRAKAITRQRFALPTPLLSFARHPGLTDQLARVVRLVHGRG